MTDQQRKAMEEEKYLEMIRTSEDYYDTIDCEKETREDLEKRQVIMNETRIEKKPYQELYKGINKQINNFAKWSKERTEWSNMAGPKRDKR